MIQTHVSISEIDCKQWRRLAETSPLVTFFQTEECYRFYDSLSFLRPFVFGVSEQSRLVGVLCGYIIAEKGLIKHFFSRRAIVPGGILLDENVSGCAITALLKKALEELSKKSIYVEIRNYKDYSRFKPLIENSGFIYQPHYDIHVNLTDEKQMFLRIGDSKRRQLKTAEANGVEWQQTSLQSDVEAFYRILAETYRLRVKRPLFPIEFFEKIVKTEQGKLLVVKNNNRVIGGMVCIVENDTAYEWFVCGEAGNKDYASVVATWAGLCLASKSNCSKFDFMGAGKPNVPYGVRDFKMQFGGYKTEIGRFIHINNSFLYFIGKMVVTLVGKLHYSFFV